MPPSSPNSNLHMCQFLFVVPLILRSSRLVPTCCAQEASSSSTLSIPIGRRRLWQVQVRPAPRSVWCGRLPSHADSQLLARRRAARDSLKGSRRSRAPRPPSFRQLSHRACLFACTFSLAVSRSLGRCLGRPRIMTVNEWWKELVIFVRIDVSVCHSY